MKILPPLLLFMVLLMVCCVAESSIQKPAVTMKEISVKYDKGYDTQYGYYKAPEGKYFLVTYLVFEDHACKNFELRYYSIKCQVDGVIYSPTMYYGSNRLPNYVTLTPGSSVEGYVAFEIPAKEGITYALGYDSSSCPIEIKR